MADDDARFRAAIAAIDRVNGADRNELVIDGEARPKELVHAEIVTAWIQRLRPQAGELLLLAARGHHLRRWQSPRSDYPEGRAGYLRWRRELSDRQAEELAELLSGCGYGQPEVERVRDIVRKRGLGHDDEVQALEDALCLTFLQLQLAELASRTDELKMVDILRKTMGKMSPTAIHLAGELPLGPDSARLLAEAAG